MLADSAMDEVIVENNSLSKKEKINIFDINPMLKVRIEGADG